MGNKAELLIFAVSGLRCALPLSTIERVLRAVEVIPAPKAPDIFILPPLFRRVHFPGAILSIKSQRNQNHRAAAANASRGGGTRA